MAGCSSDVTRFNLLGADFFGIGSAERPAARPASYAPDGYGPPPGHASPGYVPPARSAAHSHGLQETALAPLSPGRDDAYRPPGRDYPPASSYPPPRHEPLARGADRGPPPWMDKQSFPWPESAADSHRHAPGQQAQGWQGRHTLQSGETLYAIARRYKVGVDELKRANGITDESKLWAGKMLSVPGRGRATASVATPAPAAASTAPPRVVQVTPRVVAPPPPEPEAAPEAPRKSAAGTGGTMTDAGASPASAASKFRWPARGRILVGFGGQQPDGTRSEGINVAVPQGTDIHAADAGRVHYVGDGLKGYGNLILIRHPNGWVSTYAHADQMLVKAGDQVRRGQVIGKAGTSGPVSQPQLRFELRKGSAPVDPLPHLGN